MRTTIRLDDQLLAEIKNLAAQRGQTMTAIIEDALRIMISQRKQLENQPKVSIITVSGNGLQAGVDLDDSAALLDLMGSNLMILPDVNVLVYAHREDSPNHQAYREWLEETINGEHSFGISELVLSGFLRIVTHPRIFDPPSDMTLALAFANQIRERPNCILINPGPRHWDIFQRLCSESGVKGNLVPDAYLAALAIDSGSEWITTDRDFSRFPGLKWRHPLY